MPSVTMAGGNLLVPKIEKWAEKRRKSGGSSMAPEQLLSANDDQVEKENARQNATPQGGIGMTPFKSMKGDAKKRQSFDARGGEMSMTPQGGRLDGERLKSLYGDCIKLANENKITQKNAWTMNLLDHIRGLTGNGGETDFVTAGCTLDAAGKIYSCRVDSVHNETFRVCTGLSRSAMPNEEEDKEEGEGGDSENEGEEEEGAGKKKRAKKAFQGSSTLESNPDALIQKKLDTESHVDPLFQTMCKAFDEGGARGLLLNQLSLGTGCTVMIDSNAIDDPNVPQILASEDNKLVVTEKLDASDLKMALFTLLGVSSPEEFNKSLAESDVCPHVAKFLGLPANNESVPAFAPDAAHLVALPADRAPLSPLSVGNDDAGAMGGDAGGADEGYGDMGDGDMGGDDDMEDDGDALEDQMMAEIDGDEVRLGGLGALRKKGGGTGLGFTGAVEALESNLDINDDYSYFSQDKLARNWAGPSHWTFRSRPQAPALSLLEKADALEQGKKGRKKETFTLDLRAPLTEAMKANMAKSKTSTVLAAPPSATDSNTLPDDHHFDPALLFSLFLRPRSRLRPRMGRVAGSGAGLQDGGWCSDGDDNAGDMDDDNDGGGFGDYDGGGASMSPENVQPGGITLLAAPRRAQKIEIGYATTAKKIDIKALKENLWDSITEAPDQKVDFSKTITAVPLDQFPEVSVPFCFICLLHLCNEKSLALLGSGQERDGMDGTLCVGNLEDLRIVLDP